MAASRGILRMVRASEGTRAVPWYYYTSDMGTTGVVHMPKREVSQPSTAPLIGYQCRRCCFLVPIDVRRNDPPFD